VHFTSAETQLKARMSHFYHSASLKSEARVVASQRPNFFPKIAFFSFPAQRLTKKFLIPSINRDFMA
jgi:hypothetical protein